MATHPPNSLMGLPTELRLLILEHVVQEDTTHNFEKTNPDSDSGYSLFQLWHFLFCGHKAYKLDAQTDRMTRWGLWSSLSNISTPQEPYIFRPHVPAVLQVNQTLSGEGREVYLKFARKQMASYETRHKELLPFFIDGYEAWKVRPYLGPGTCIGHEKGQLREEGLELAELCLRWFALKQTCELLEKEGGEGGSAGGK